MMNEPLSSIMATDLRTLDVNANLTAVLDIMKTHKVHHLPVVDGKKLVGIISSWDLLKLNKSFEEYHTINVRDIMTTKMAYLDPNDHIGAAAEVLLENLFHAIPVVNDDHDLLGMVTAYDILKYENKKEYPDEV
ncbi:MAG: HPP family protein [Saprospiraceae bacterium]